MAKKWKKAIWGTIATLAISSAVVCAAVSCGSNSNSSNNQSSSSSTTGSQTMSNSLIVASIANELTNNTGSLSAKGISSGAVPTTYITDSKQDLAIAWGNYFASKAPNGYLASLSGYQSVTVPTDQVTFNVISTNYQNDSLRLELNYKNAGATITIDNIPQTNLPAPIVVNQLATTLAGNNLSIDAANISALSGLNITNNQQVLTSTIFDYLQSLIPQKGLTFSQAGYNSVTIKTQNIVTSANPGGNLVFDVGNANLNNDTVPVTITYNGSSSNITITNITQAATPSAYVLKSIVNNITNNTDTLNVSNISSLQTAYLTDSLSSLSQTYNTYFQSLFTSKDFQETGYSQVSVNSTAISYIVSAVNLASDTLTVTASYNGAHYSFTLTNVPQTQQSQQTIVGDIINTLTNNAGSIQAMNIPELASYNLASPTASINNAITKYLNSQFGTNGVTYSETGFLPTTVQSTNVSYSYSYSYSTNAITVTITYGNASGAFIIESVPSASFSNSEIAQFIVNQLLNGASSLNASTVSYLTNINLATPNITNAINQDIASQFTTTGWVLQKQGYTSITIDKASLTSGMVKISVAPVSDGTATVTITYNGSAASMLQVTNIENANFSNQTIANDIANKLTNSTTNTIAFSSISSWKNYTILDTASFVSYFTSQFTTAGWTFSQTGYNSVTINSQSLSSGMVTLTMQTPDYANNTVDLVVNYNGAKATITITGVPSATFSDLTIANDIKNELTNNSANGLDFPNVSYFQPYNLQTNDLTSKLATAIESQFTTKGWTFSQTGYNSVTITSSNLTSSTNKVSITVASPVAGNATVTVMYGTAKVTFQIINIPNSNMTVATYLKDNYVDKLTNDTLNIANLTFPSQSDAKSFTAAQVINSKHQKYYTTLIFEQYLASLGVKNLTINDVQYTVQEIADDLSSMLPSAITEANFNAGTIPNVTISYNGTSIGTITITGFAKPQTKDINMQDMAIANQLKNYIAKLSNQTLDIANWKFPTSSDVSLFNALQVLHSNQLSYYTALIFKTYFANNNITTITANGVIYPVADLANQLAAMLPTTITEADFNAGTVSGIKLAFANDSVGTISITGFAKPTTSNINAQNTAIANEIKKDISGLNGTLDLTKIKFTDNNPTVFTVQEVINSKHQKYYTTWIFEQYFANSNINTITVNGIQYTVLQIANQMSSIIPLNPTSSEIKSGTISNISINFNGIDVGTINITGFKTATTNQTSSNN